MAGGHKHHHTRQIRPLPVAWQSYGETTEQQKAVGSWLCNYAEHRQPFDEIKHCHTLNEADDVAEGRHDWMIERGRGGINL